MEYICRICKREWKIRHRVFYQMIIWKKKRHWQNSKAKNYQEKKNRTKTHTGISSNRWAQIRNSANKYIHIWTQFFKQRNQIAHKIVSFQWTNNSQFQESERERKKNCNTYPTTRRNPWLYRCKCLPVREGKDTSILICMVKTRNESLSFFSIKRNKNWIFSQEIENAETKPCPRKQRGAIYGRLILVVKQLWLPRKIAVVTNNKFLDINMQLILLFSWGER